MSLEDRMRRLEEKFARLDIPDLTEVLAAFTRIASRATSRLYREASPGSTAGQDDDLAAVQKWQKMSGANLEAEAEKVRAKLEDMGQGLRSPD